VSVEIIRKDIKYIYIRIKAPSKVVVTAPLHAKQQMIDRLLTQKANWIAKQLAKQKPIQDISYTQGAMIPFLGRDYELTITHAPHTHITVEGGRLHCSTPHIDSPKKLQEAIEQWYRTQAKIYCEEAIDKYHPFVNRPIHAVRIKRMKTRWGSCNHTKGYINLNVELIKKPLEALEYVVLHELVHLIYPNHSQAFYYYIEHYMPDWKARVALLK